MTRPAMLLTSVTIAAPDPRALAEFYAELLGWPITASDPPGPGEPPTGGWAQVKPPPGSGQPTLNLEYEAAYVAPTWPSRAGEQHITVHLDIAVAALAPAVEWAESCGARLADVQPQDDVRVLLDPAGQPFCLFLWPELPV